MNIVEVATIALLVLSIGFQILIARGNARITAQGISHLDNSTAEALQALLEQLPETLKGLLGQIDPPEPVNPIQMMIAQILQDRMNPTIEAKVVTQDPGTGRFQKLEDS